MRVVTAISTALLITASASRSIAGGGQAPSFIDLGDLAGGEFREPLMSIHSKQARIFGLGATSR